MYTDDPKARRKEIANLKGINMLNMKFDNYSPKKMEEPSTRILEMIQVLVNNFIKMGFKQLVADAQAERRGSSACQVMQLCLISLVPGLIGTSHQGTDP